MSSQQQLDRLGLKPLSLYHDEEETFATVTRCLGNYFEARASKYETLELDNILRKANLFKLIAEYTTPRAFVEKAVSAHLITSHLTIFGQQFGEPLALDILYKHKGWKSGITGMDAEYINGRNRYLISIKSSPNWGNSTSTAQLEDNFKTATKVLKQDSHSRSQNPIAILGCTVGSTRSAHNGTRYKIVGAAFWYFLTGIEDYALTLAHLVQEATAHLTKGQEEAKLEELDREFYTKYCRSSGTLNLEKLQEVCLMPPKNRKKK